MSTVAPFVFPTLASADMMKRTRMATYAEVVAPAALRGRDYGSMDDDADIDAFLWGIHSVVCPRTPAVADLPMPPPELHYDYDSRRDGYHYGYGSYLEAVLRGIRIPVASFASMPVDDASDDSPRTPAAAVVLPGPLSYGGDDDCSDAVTIKNKTKRPPEYDYDAGIDATFRSMERESMERPSPDYLSDRQEGEMMMMDRADLIQKMHRFCFYSDHDDLAPGTFHRAVSFVDRFLSAKKISRDDDRKICLLGAAAVFAAAKYEDRSTVEKINSDDVAKYAGCTRSEAVEQERELVATIGYRLSGPTAYMFVDHFMRHSLQEDEKEKAIRALAHHLADMALLDYRCVAFLPSVVAASAILLARTVVYYPMVTPVVGGYTVEELSDCIQAIHDMHENMQVWSGCAQMMIHWAESTAHHFHYFLPPLSMLIAMQH